MKKFVFYLFLLIIPVLLFEVALNYYVDPNGLYYNYSSDKEKYIVDGLNKGWCVTNLEGYQEGSLKKKLAESRRNKHFDYLIMGASRSMTISSAAFPNHKVLNLSASTCQLEDIIAFYYISKINNVKADTIVIAIDPTFLTNNYDGLRWVSNGSYYDQFLGKESVNIDYKLFLNLIDPSYTQLSIKKINTKFRSTQNADDNNKYTKEQFNKDVTYLPDGAFTYSEAYRNQTQQEIDGKAASSTNSTFDPNDKVSSDDIRNLDILIEDIKQNGITPVFICAPYHPYFYSRIIKMHAVKDMMDYIYNYAEKKGIKVIGRYSPKECGVSNNAFYDEVHMKSETINQMIRDFSN